MAIDSVAKMQANGGLTGELAAVGAAKDLAAYYAADQTLSAPSTASASAPKCTSTT